MKFEEIPEISPEEEKKIVLSIGRDSKAFEYIYEKYMPGIFNFVLYRVKERELAEDIVSAVFYKAFKNIPFFRFRKLPFSSYLYKIAHHEVINQGRRIDKFRQLKKILEPEYSDIAEDSIVEEDLRFELVKPYIEQLSEEDQNLIYLRFYEKKTHVELAQIVGKNETTVRVHVGRIIRRLRKKIAMEVNPNETEQNSV